MTTEVDVREYATAVARYGLPGAEPPPRLEDDAWSLALATLAEEKVLGIATAAADAGWLPLRDDQYEELVARQRRAMEWCLALERRLLDVADAFDTEGIDFIVLKGPALARTVYPDPSWRTFNDLDLLVRTSQWGTACDVLQAGFGWPRRVPEPRPGFDVRFGKAAVFTTTAGLQVDLHRNLAQGPYGVWIEPEELFGRTTPGKIAGRILPRLDPTAAFLHACVHAVLGDGRRRLIEARDVVETGRVPLDREWLQRVARTWRVGPVIERAVEIARPVGVVADVAIRSSSRDAWPLRAYDDGRRDGVGVHLAMLRAIPGLQQKARYVRDLTVPSSEFVRARGASRWR
ncbi:MAG: nucleotidyltransferase family protein, partial [Actinomycetota bacterium]